MKVLYSRWTLVIVIVSLLGLVLGCSNPKHSDGSWKIFRDCFNSNVPPK